MVRCRGQFLVLHEQHFINLGVLLMLSTSHPLKILEQHACMCTYITPRVLLSKKTWVGPKNVDENEASISCFIVNEGGSQKYG